MQYKIYAWGWKSSGENINILRNRIHENLGIIHYPHTYHLAKKGDIAYVSNTDAAQMVVEYGDIFSHVILGDERNIEGPSGYYETPEEYNERLGESYRILEEAGISTSSKGLAMVPTRWRIPSMWGISKFDHEYHEKISIGRHSAVNTTPVHYSRMLRGIRNYPNDRFFVTLIPWRWRWDFTLGFILQSLMIPGVGRQFRNLARDEQVIGVGVWCLKEGYSGYLGRSQNEHGLINRKNILTWQGRMIGRILDKETRSEY